jgi:hypothetical protein
MKRYLPQKPLHESLSWTIQAKIIIFDSTSEPRVVIAVEIVIKMNNLLKINLRMQNLKS